MREASTALADFNKAIELDPNNDEAYFQRGMLAAKGADTERAMGDFDKAIQLAPTNAMAYAGVVP